MINNNQFISKAQIDGYIEKIIEYFAAEEKSKK